MGLELATALVVVRADGSFLRSDFNRMKGPAKQSATKLGTVMGQTMSRAFGAAGVLGIGLAFQRIANMGEQFNRKMRNSLAIMGDVSLALRQDMKEAALEAARTTQFSGAQAAESFFFLASAGLDASQSIVAMPQVAKFAQAGMFDLSRATDLATDAQSALGLTVADAQQNLINMTRVTDVLVKGNTLANASVEQLSQSLTTKAGAAAKIAGIELEEVVSVLLALADQGVKSHDAGTAVNIVLRDLKTKAVENEAAFKKFNVSVFDSTGAMNNMADIIGDIEKALEGMEAKQQNVTLSTLGFIDKSKIFLQSLIGTSEKMRGFQKALEDVGGTTADVASKQLTPFQKAIAKIGVAFTRLGLVFVEIISPMMTTLGDSIGTVIKLTTALLAVSVAYKLMSLRIRILTGAQIAFNAVQVITTLLAGANLLAITKVTTALAAGVVAFALMDAALGQASASTNKLSREAEEAVDTLNKMAEGTNSVSDGLQSMAKSQKQFNKASNEGSQAISPQMMKFLDRVKEVTKERNKLPPTKAKEPEFTIVPIEPTPGFFQAGPPLAITGGISALEEQRIEVTKFAESLRKNKEEAKRVSDAYIPFSKNLKEMKEATEALKEITDEMKTPYQEFLELQKQLNEIMRKNPELTNMVTRVWNQARNDLTGFSDTMRDLNNEFIKLTTNMGDNEFRIRKFIDANSKLLSTMEKQLLLQKALQLDATIKKQEKAEESKRKTEQRALQIEQAKVSFIEGLRSPTAKLFEEFKKIEFLRKEGRITEEQRQRGLRGLRGRVQQPDQISGRFGFAAFGAAIQDALLKDDTAKKSLREQQRTNAFLEFIDSKLAKPLEVKGVALPEGPGV